MVILHTDHSSCLFLRPLLSRLETVNALTHLLCRCSWKMACVWSFFLATLTCTSFAVVFP